MKRKILIGSALLLLIAQFFQPDRTVPAYDASTDMLVMTNAPESMAKLVRQACYDCHSYETNYPFYSYITPVNFWTQSHVNEAREELNFSRWDLSAGSEAASECGEETAEGEMPLPSYTWLHGEARLSPTDRNALVNWFNSTTRGGEKEEEHEPVH